MALASFYQQHVNHVNHMRAMVVLFRTCFVTETCAYQWQKIIVREATPVDRGLN